LTDRERERERQIVQPYLKLPCLQYTILSLYLFSYPREEKHPSAAGRILGATDAPFQTTLLWQYSDFKHFSSNPTITFNMVHFCPSQYSQIIVALRDLSVRFFSGCSKWPFSWSFLHHNCIWFWLLVQPIV